MIFSMLVQIIMLQVTPGNFKSHFELLLNRYKKIEINRHIKYDYIANSYNRESKLTSQLYKSVTYSQLRNRHVVFNADGTDARMVFADCSKYHFYIHKNGLEWIIVDLYFVPLEKPSRLEPYQMACGSCNMNLSYSELLLDRSTKIIELRNTLLNGINCNELIVESTYSFNREFKSKIPKRYGLVSSLEMPDLVTACRLYDNENVAQWLYEERVLFDDPKADFPFFKSIEFYVADKTANYEPWLKTRFEKVSYALFENPLPESEFKLTAFNLPEPKTIPKAPEIGGKPTEDDHHLNFISKALKVPESKNYFWVIVAILSLASAGIAFFTYRRLRQRYRESQ